MPPGPQAPEETLRQLDDIGSPATMAMGRRRFFGFVIGGALPVDVAATGSPPPGTRTPACTRRHPPTAELERIALGWLLDVLGLPPASGGAFVTGATMANFSALAAARHAVLARAGWDVEADGLFGAPPITVVVGDEAHPTRARRRSACSASAAAACCSVPVDGQGRMRADALPRDRRPGRSSACRPATSTPAPSIRSTTIVAEAHARGAWVHVDGAFGLWAAAAPRCAPLTAASAQADSWATDAHKWLNVPYDSGVAFVRDAAGAARGDGDHRRLPADRGRRQRTRPTTRRSCRAARAASTSGRRCARSAAAALAEMIERCCRHARRFAEGLRGGRLRRC